MDNKKIYNEIIKKLIEIEESYDLNNPYLLRGLNTIEWLYGLLNEEGKNVYLKFCYDLFNRNISCFGCYEKRENAKEIDLVNDFIFFFCISPDISFSKLVKAYSKDDLFKQSSFLQALTNQLNVMDLSLYKPDCNLVKVQFIPKSFMKN